MLLLWVQFFDNVAKCAFTAVKQLPGCFLCNFVFNLTHATLATRLFLYKMLLKISQISQESTCFGVSFWQSCMPEGCLKETRTQEFSCEISEILRAPSWKNIYERLLQLL